MEDFTYASGTKGQGKVRTVQSLFHFLYQNLLILLFSSPIILVSKYPGNNFNPIDIFAASLMLLFILN